MQKSPGCSSAPMDDAWLFKVLMDTITDGVYFKDLESRFIAGSRALAELFGISDPAELKGKTDFDFFTKEHAQQAFDDEQAIIRSGTPIVGKEEKETWGARPNSWVSSTKMPLRDPQGAIVGTFGISRSITQQKHYQLKLEESEARLRLHVERMQHELQRAQVVQKALLPDAPPVCDRFITEFRYKPMESIGGDFISFFPKPDGSIGIFIADVSGHGVSAALFVVLLKFLTDRLAADRYGTDPAAFIDALHAQLDPELRASFVTAIYCLLTPEAADCGGRLVYASAGHPPPLFIDSRTGTVRRLEHKNAPAIGISGPFAADAREVQLARGDRILLYSDGLTEARNAKGEIIGGDILNDRIREGCKGPIGRLLDDLLSDVNKLCDEELADDIVLCGIEVR